MPDREPHAPPGGQELLLARARGVPLTALQAPMANEGDAVVFASFMCFRENPVRRSRDSARGDLSRVLFEYAAPCRR
jgi:hypothetical protein